MESWFLSLGDAAAVRISSTLHLGDTSDRLTHKIIALIFSRTFGKWNHHMEVNLDHRLYKYNGGGVCICLIAYFDHECPGLGLTGTYGKSPGCSIPEWWSPLCLGNRQCRRNFLWPSSDLCFNTFLIQFFWPCSLVFRDAPLGAF